MDIKSFIEHFVRHPNKTQINDIVHGIQKSTISSGGIGLGTIPAAMLDKSKPQEYTCNQSGTFNATAAKNKSPHKKTSYCTDFGVIIDNILTIFGYEFSKYLLSMVHSKDILRKIRQQIEEADSFAMLSKYVNHFAYVACRGIITVDISNFKRVCASSVSSEFMQRHQIDVLADVFTNLERDITIASISSGVSVFMEISEVAKDLTSKVIDLCGCEQRYIINDIQDILFELRDLEICYDGSFIQMAFDLYRESSINIPQHRTIFTTGEFDRLQMQSPYENVVQRFELKSIVTVKLDEINAYFRKLAGDVFEISSPGNVLTNIEITSMFFCRMSEIIINYFVMISNNLLIHHDIKSSFDRSSRVQFALILTTVLGTTPRFVAYTESQRTLIHYTLILGKSMAAAVEKCIATCNSEI